MHSRGRIAMQPINKYSMLSIKKRLSANCPHTLLTSQIMPTNMSHIEYLIKTYYILLLIL